MDRDYSCMRLFNDISGYVFEVCDLLLRHIYFERGILESINLQQVTCLNLNKSLCLSGQS